MSFQQINLFVPADRQDCVRTFKVSKGGHRICADPIIFLQGPEDVVKIIKALKSGEKLKTPLSVGKLFDRCHICGENVTFVTDGVNLNAVKRCEYPKGVMLECELNVPSGVMVFGSDLSEFQVDEDPSDDFGIMGRVEMTRRMEAIGCAYAGVGNSCPGVYKIGTDKFIIAHSGFSPKTGNERRPKAERVATVGEWHYSIVDNDEYIRRGCEGMYNVDKVSVRPGVYRFTHNYLYRIQRRDRPQIVTTIEWIRPPDPVQVSNP